MKKIFKSLFLMAAASATIIACNKEVATPSGEELVNVTIIAGNPATEAATKTEIDGLQPYWSVGDKIGVSDGTSNEEFTTGIESRSATASFVGTTSVSSDLYAYYPFSSAGVSSSKVAAKVDIPITQNPTATSFDGKADLMVSKQFTVDPANTTVSGLEFKRLGAVVKLVLKDKESVMTSTQHPSKVSLTAASNLVGRVYVDFENQELGELYYNQSKTVNANYTELTQYAIDGTNATYIIVYPQTLAAGSTITVTANTENYSIEKVITVPEGGIALEAGKITTLNINLYSSHITATDSGAALPFNDDMAWANNGDADSNTDISGSISSPENSNGLYVSASKAYKGIGGLKLGSSKGSGSITTKELDLSGAFNIVVSAGQWGEDTGNIVVTIDGKAAEINSSDFSDVLYANVAAGTYTNKSQVTIGTSSKRAYLYSVNITEGEYVVPAPVINVNSANPMAVANTASSQTITYKIANPTTATLTAALKESASWISNIDYATSGKVTFDVAAQDTDAPARSAVIVLNYEGATAVEVTVNQAEGPSSGSGGSDPVTVVFVAGTDTGSTSVTKGGITVSMSTMSRTDNYRTYANTDMTVSSTVGNISEVVITCTASGNNNYGPGKFSGNGYSYSGDKGTWTGSSTSVTLSASTQVRITQISVTYTPSN